MNLTNNLDEYGSMDSKALSRASELIGALLNGNIPAELRTRVQEWFKSPASEEAKYLELQRIIENELKPNLNPDSYEYEQYEKLCKLLGIDHGKRQKNRLPLFPRIALRVAAVLLPLFVLGGVLTTYLKEPAYTTLTASAEGIEEVFLPDNSKVRLFPGSSITFRKDFSKDRRVSLNGEAIFKVTRTTEATTSRTFTVSSGPLDVTVLGTEFKVINIEGDDSSAVILFTGNVNVRAGVTSSQMSEGEKLVYDHGNQVAAVKQVTLDEQIKEGYLPSLVFRDATLKQMIRVIEVRHAVKFIMPDDTELEGRYSADFEGDSLTKILKLLSIIDDRFSYALEEDRVKMTKNP